MNNNLGKYGAEEKQIWFNTKMTNILSKIQMSLLKNIFKMAKKAILFLQ